MEYDPDLRKNVKEYVKVLCNEARSCQSYGQREKPRTTPRPTDTSTKNSETTPTDTKAKPPVCWWHPHAKKGIRHHLDDRKECPAEEKEKIKREKREAAKNKEKGVKRVNEDEKKAKAVLYSPVSMQDAPVTSSLRILVPM